MNIITTTDDLEAFCERCSKSPYIAIDTEFMRETTYWPRLCLVQVATPEEAAIIDPMAEPAPDLAPLVALVQNPAVTKVFHAARQDIEIFVKLGGRVPEPLFDTQVAAMVCGFGEQIAYDQLVLRVTGDRIDKSSRFTNWANRPLSKAQLAYALADVTHLCEIYEYLSQALAEQGRTDWVKEEMAVLTAAETYSTRPQDAWQRLKLKARAPVEFAVLREIAALREEEAQTRDVPRGRILKDDVIYEIATHRPDSQEALGRLRSFPQGLERSRLGQRVVAAVKAVLERPEESWPALPERRPSADGASAAVELMKVLLRLTAERHGVAAKVIATVDDLEALVATPDAPQPVLTGWRRTVFGEQALQLLAGEVALGFNGRRAVAISLGEPIAKVSVARKPRRRRKPKAEGAASPPEAVATADGPAT